MDGVPQQERSQTGYACCSAKHGKQMASNRALSVQCRVVCLEEKVEQNRPGWMVSGHLSTSQQGVILKGGKLAISSDLISTTDRTFPLHFLFLSCYATTEAES